MARPSRHPSGAVAAFLAVSAALLLPATDARAAESYDECRGFITTLPAVITMQGTWCLQQDLATSITSGPAITIATSNVTLDCNHYKLGGLSAGAGTGARGVSSDDVRLNTTIRNCNIRGFLHGIDLIGEGALVEDNRLESNRGSGIRIAAAGDSVIRRNMITDTGGGVVGNTFGIYVELGAPRIEDNYISGVSGNEVLNVNAYGIRMYGGWGSALDNTVQSVTPSGTGLSYAIDATNAFSVLIRGNYISGYPAAPEGSIAIRCSAGYGSARDNAAASFPTGLVNCFDDGGNTFR